MKPYVIAIIIGVSFIIALGRFMIPGHALSYAGAYEAVAHIWVGFLIAQLFLRPISFLCALMLFAISSVEVIAFLTRSAAVLLAFVFVLAGSYSAFADPVAVSNVVTVSWGNMLLSALQYTVYTIVLPVLATWVAVYFKDTQSQKMVSEILDKAAEYGIAVTSGAVKGQTFDIPMTNAALAAAEQYVLANAPAWAKALGNTLRPKILARIGAKTPIAPEATASDLGVTLPNKAA